MTRAECHPRVYLDQVRVEQVGAVHRVAGRVGDMDGPWEYDSVGFLGVGAVGHLVASVYAIEHGADCAFFRHAPKDHGTMRQLDGSLGKKRYLAFMGEDLDPLLLHRGRVRHCPRHCSLP